MRLSFFAAAFLALAASPVYALNKCVQANGRIVYQDKGCPSDSGKTLTVTEANGQTDAALRNNIAARRTRSNTPEEITEALRLREPVVGMTLAQMTQALGMAGMAVPQSHAQMKAREPQQYVFTSKEQSWLASVLNGMVIGLDGGLAPSPMASASAAEGEAKQGHQESEHGAPIKPPFQLLPKPAY